MYKCSSRPRPSPFSDHLDPSFTPFKMPLVLEPQAKVFYNILGALFDHSDANFEPKDIGLWTLEKERALLVETDQVELSEGLHTLNSPIVYVLIHDSVQNNSWFGLH